MRMGWNSGSEIFDKVMQILNDHVEDSELREAIYVELIPLFEDYDCDTLNELLEQDEAFDAAYKHIYDDKSSEDDTILGTFDDED